ncbi:acrosin-like isoform X3 [Cuculus canorus]|nr:acrosin-like isoform X3 [Cuculus canorus]
MTRVVGGRDAQAGAWPWIVSIQSPWEAGTGHICGGSLIGTQWVLTAAHCFTEAMNTEMWRVVAGATDLTQLGPEVQIRSIKQIFVHENYNNISQRNDIALLELDQPVQCSSHVQLACLPNATLKASQLTTCYVSGWGATHEEGGTSDVLQEAKVPLIDTHVCNSSGWYRGAIHTHNLCAGYPRGGIDTCQVGAGDKSSPSSTSSPGTDTQTYRGAQQVPVPPPGPTAPGAHLPFPISRTLPRKPTQRSRGQSWNIPLPHSRGHAVQRGERAQPYSPTTPSQTRFCQLLRRSRAFLCRQHSSGSCWERGGAGPHAARGPPAPP